MGAEVGQLEAAVAQLSQTRHAVGCASGTDALLLPLKALDLRPRRRGDHHPVHLLRHRGRHPQCRRHPGVRGHRTRPRSTSRRPRSRRRSRRGRGPSSPCTCSARWRRWSGPGPIAARHGAGADRGRRPVHRRPAQGGRRLADGRRAGHGRHPVVLPQQEPGRVRRRRHDGDPGRCAGRAASPAPAPRRARTQYFHDEVGFNSRLDTAARGGAAGQAAAPRGVERGPGPSRRALHRGLHRKPRRVPAPNRPGQRAHLQPVHRPGASAGRAAGPPQGQAASGTRSTIRCRSTCSRASPTSATPRATSRCPRRRPRRSSRSRSIRR